MQPNDIKGLRDYINVVHLIYYQAILIQFQMQTKLNNTFKSKLYRIDLG